MSFSRRFVEKGSETRTSIGQEEKLLPQQHQQQGLIDHLCSETYQSTRVLILLLSIKNLIIDMILSNAVYVLD